jgi:hypothetical protein
MKSASRAADSATNLREAADFETPDPGGAGTSPLGSRTARPNRRVDTLISIRFIAQRPSQSADAQVATPDRRSEEAARSKHTETIISDLAGPLRRQKSGEAVPRQAIEDANAELRPSVHQKRGQPKEITTNAETTRQSVATGATEQSSSTEANGTVASGLLARAKVLIKGNISAARNLLKRAAETGSAQATFALAETYDPNILSIWKAHGTRGDATKARNPYAKTYSGGIKAAKDRSQALVVVSGQRKPAGWFGRVEPDDY